MAKYVYDESHIQKTVSYFGTHLSVSEFGECQNRTYQILVTRDRGTLSPEVLADFSLEYSEATELKRLLSSFL